ncbi:MAG: M1 family aminopeptidase, partial [Nocardioidaceae bacterium]
HPSDKAMYDVRVTAPGRWVGVSNGTLVSRRRVDGRTVTRWSNTHPMSSYLTTLAVGPYRVYHQTGPGGLPLSYWVPRSHPEFVKPLLKTAAAMRWLARRLGPYPFDTAGVVVTPRGSAMETQTMVTFGAGLFRNSSFDVRSVLVHELAHQWYGDTVTPTDWRDVWMNEGMATYVEARWQSEHSNAPMMSWRNHVGYWTVDDQWLRDQYGPPGAFHHDEFGSANVYYSPALMWERLRRKVGTTTFDRLVRAWPQTHRDTSSSREEMIDWWEARTDRDLSRFFTTWLTSEESPA